MDEVKKEKELYSVYFPYDDPNQKELLAKIIENYEKQIIVPEIKINNDNTNTN